MTPESGKPPANLVGNKHDAVPVADPAQRDEQFGRGRQEAPLALHRLDDDGGDVLGRDVGAEDEVERAQRVRHAGVEAVGGKRHVEDAGWGNPEFLLIGRHLAGEAHGQGGAAVEAAGEGDDAGPAGGGAGDLDRILDGLGAGREQDGAGVAGKGRERVEPFAQRHIGLIGQDLESGVGIGLELVLHRGQHARVAMAGVEHGDAGREVDVAPALDIPDFGVLGPRRIDGEGVGYAPGDAGLPTCVQGGVGGHRELRRKIARSVAAACRRL